MGKGLMAMALTATACLAATGAGAQTKPGWTSFTVGGANFEMPIPAGFCLPNGKTADAARLLATGDKDNVTSVTLLSCTGDGFDTYILIKTPVSLSNTDFTREETLKSLGAAFETPLFKDRLPSAVIDKSAQGLSEAFGQKVDLAGEVKPLGKDQACAYLGGTMDVKMPQITYRVSVGTCLTAVGRRFIAVNAYGPDKGSAGVAALVATARRVMETIRPSS